MRLAVLTLGLALSLCGQDGMRITIEAKGTPKASAEVPFEVTVKDIQGKMVEGATVQVTATMVDMDHGEFKFDGKPKRAGVYEVTPKFVMGGAWNLRIKAIKGGSSAATDRKIEVKD